MISKVILDIKRVLIVRPDVLGDVILTFPMLVRLKQEFPKCEVYYLCSEYTKPLIEVHPLVSGTIIDTSLKGCNKSEISKLIKAIASYNFDVVLNCYNEVPFPMIMKKAQIPIRIGDASKFPLSMYHTHKVDLCYRDITVHVAEQNLKLLAPLGINPVVNEINFGLGLKQTLSEEVVSMMNGTKDYIIVHPGFGQGNGKALLSEDKYREVIKQLLDKGEKIVVTGGPKEEIRNKNICAGLEGVFDLTAKTILLDLVSIIQGAKLMISVDTGPMHLASALKVPVVLLNLTKFVKPSGWGPLFTLRIVTPSVKCKLTCFPFTCTSTYCADNFLVSDILKAVQDIKTVKSMTFKEIKKETLKVSLNILNLTNEKLGIESEYKVYTKADVGKSFFKFVWNYDINIVVKDKVKWWDNSLISNLLAPKLYYPTVFIDRAGLDSFLY